VSGPWTPVTGSCGDSSSGFELADAGVVVVSVASSDEEPGGLVEGGPVGVVAVVDDEFDEGPEVAFD
jgi:hypothetical protein